MGHKSEEMPFSFCAQYGQNVLGGGAGVGVGGYVIHFKALGKGDGLFNFQLSIRGG